MQKEKINLCEKRSFSDAITTAFVFVRQEFKSLITGFAVFVLPLIFVDLFIKSGLLTNMVVEEQGRRLPLNTGMTVLIYLWVFYMLILFVNAYLRLYEEDFRTGNEEKITVNRIGRLMLRQGGRLLGLYFVYLLMVFVGLLFLVIPGIYIAIIFSFCFCFLIIRDKSLGDSLEASFGLVKGHWWYLFAFTLVMRMITGVIGYVFSLPYMLIAFRGIFTEGEVGIYEATFGLLVANVGGYFLYLIFFIGVGVAFFSRLEQEEHTTLLKKIGQIGNNVQTQESEEVL